MVVGCILRPTLVLDCVLRPTLVVDCVLRPTQQINALSRTVPSVTSGILCSLCRWNVVVLVW